MDGGVNARNGGSLFGEGDLIRNPMMPGGTCLELSLNISSVFMLLLKHRFGKSGCVPYGRFCERRRIPAHGTDDFRMEAAETALPHDNGR
jgi:hypothetical protein